MMCLFYFWAFYGRANGWAILSECICELNLKISLCIPMYTMYIYYIVWVCDASQILVISSLLTERNGCLFTKILTEIATFSKLALWKRNLSMSCRRIVQLRLRQFMFVYIYQLFLRSKNFRLILTLNFTLHLNIWYVCTYHGGLELKKH